MNISTLLQLLTGAPLEIAQVVGIWNAVKGGFATTDQAAIDAIIARLDTKTEADVAQLHADAAAS